MGRGGTTGGQGSGVSRTPATPPKKSAVKPAKPSIKIAKPPIKPPVKITKPIKRPFFTCTDSGNTRRLVHYEGTNFKYVTKFDQHIIWRGTSWEIDESGGGMLRISQRVVDTIKEDADALVKNKAATKKDMNVAGALKTWWKASEARARREAMIYLAHGEPGIEIAHTKLDANPWLFGVADGVIDLQTGKKMPPDRKYLLTKKVSYRYVPGAKAKLWEKFLGHVVPDKEIRDFLQRFVGYCLTGMVTERMFLILFGGGKNGKSVFIDTLQELLGPYGTSAAPGLLMSKNEAHPTEVADLFGVRLAVASEIKKGRVFDEEAVKRLTGNDRLKARKMHENFWEFIPTFKLMLATNHKPQVRDDTPSFWDRLALIPFEVRISEEEDNKQLGQQLKAELPGILNWAIEGCVAWQKNGLKRPKAVMEAVDEYRSNEDTLGKFFEEECRFEPHFETKTTELTTAIRNWCKANNLTYTYREKDLAEKLAENGCIRDRVGPKQSRARGWKGLGLLRHGTGGAVFEPIPVKLRSASDESKIDEPSTAVPEEGDELSLGASPPEPIKIAQAEPKAARPIAAKAVAGDKSKDKPKTLSKPSIRGVTTLVDRVRRSKPTDDVKD